MSIGTASTCFLTGTIRRVRITCLLPVLLFLVGCSALLSVWLRLTPSHLYLRYDYHPFTAPSYLQAHPGSEATPPTAAPGTGFSGAELAPSTSASSSTGLVRDYWRDWRPAQDRLQTLYGHLNISKEQLNIAQVASQLPLTLHDPDRLDNRSLCRTPDGRPLDIVFLVLTSVHHTDRRLNLRSTYLNTTLYPGLEVRWLFLLGETTDNKTQKMVEAEHAQYGDILQGRFLDTYVNLTHKTVLGLRWLHDYCSGVRVVVKLDDDVFLDPFKLRHRYWSLMAKRSRSLWGNLYTKAKIFREGKWAINKNTFHKLSTYPYHYCAGLTFIFTGDLLPSFVAAARYVPVFWIEDIYVTGMLPFLFRNVTYHHIGYSNQILFYSTGEAQECVHSDICPMLAVHTEHPSQFQEFWQRSLRAAQAWATHPLSPQPGDAAVWLQASSSH